MSVIICEICSSVPVTHKFLIISFSLSSGGIDLGLSLVVDGVARGAITDFGVGFGLDVGFGVGWNGNVGCRIIGLIIGCFSCGVTGCGITGCGITGCGITGCGISNGIGFDIGAFGTGIVDFEDLSLILHLYKNLWIKN